jgi:hypothetical protein
MLHVCNSSINFFVAARLTSVLLSAMYYFRKRHKSRRELVSILFRFIVGSALALLVLMHVVHGGTAATNFVLSPWILPTVTLAYELSR